MLSSRSPALSVLAALFLGAVSGQPDARLAPLESRFAGLDINADGIAEIREVRDLGLARDPADVPRGTVLLVVSPTLLERSGADATDGSLEEALAVHADDLVAEGWRVRAVALDVYDGHVHQDGRTLLAMRRYLLAVREVYPDLAGATLIGSFPEAMLVRQYNWRQRQRTTLHAGQPGEESFDDREVCRLRSRAELVAGRSDLPLADLDGNWEALYTEGPEELPWVLAVYPDAEPPAGVDPEADWPLGGPTPHYETGTDRFEDFFLINDGQYTLSFPADAPAGEGIAGGPQGGAAEPADETGAPVAPRPPADLTLHDDRRDEECGPLDRALANPLARPDISISRIDAAHAALRPKPTVIGVDNDGLLDEAGLARVVTFASEEVTPRGLDIWEHDPDLELRLLCEYFGRIHRYRQGAFDEHLRPASAAFELGSFMPELRQARPEWAEADTTGLDLEGEQATLEQVVRWLRRPAVLRGIAAHSDPWGATFAKTETEALEEACGGLPWSWIRHGNRLVPTLGSTGKLDFAILRTVWQNDALPDSACFYLHSGCEIMMPAGCQTRPYSDPAYAHWQGAESLLFYGNGLALVGRSKVFYDFPRGFAAQLGEGKTFGEAWRHYFELEASATEVAEVGGGIGRKRAYFWGVIGDWTLTLRTSP